MDSPKLSLEDEEEEEKKDPENETKEGRGTPKESAPVHVIPVITPHGGTPTNTPTSFTPRKLLQSPWPPKADLLIPSTHIGVEEVHAYI